MFQRENVTPMEMEEELKKRQDEFLDKERAYKMRIEDQEDTLSKARQERTQWMDNDPNMQSVRSMHQEILKNVGVVQKRTVRLVKENEDDLLQAFRARLLTVQQELEAERSKTNDGATAWIEKTRELDQDVDRQKSNADRLDRINQTQGSENQRLKQAFSSQEDDRHHVVKQLEQCSQKNQELRKKVDEKRAELAELAHVHKEHMSQTIRERRATAVISRQTSNRVRDRRLSDSPLINTRQLGQSSMASVDSKRSSLSRKNGRSAEEMRHDDVIRRLMKMIEIERRHRRQVQDRIAQFNASITPLESSLRRCVDQICKEEPERTQSEWKHSRAKSILHTAFNMKIDREDSTPSVLTPGELNSRQRERVIESWLSLEGVLSSLCDAPPENETSELPIIKSAPRAMSAKGSRKKPARDRMKFIARPSTVRF
eukprot:CAMPEP_0185756288 /NCGR_PEP_ID=MMETSP1174-20130828/14705_1 /TAXON_ID=35687 /ORGANISM="Dictyocha speculum, Strain CCMP1381" /LENGTH=428 /DNA_ID=CAMNT_0028435173 /DNA_START=47 /DNA_END=1333 /DNA_ORIENTATION=+